ncbi:MAG TPA: hypothetical protein VGQ23_09775 [Burkholderiaceae bacterium]|jgi:hypothetical protein|nr:hypothetical protein [Burkholderiaceae bacterium]
MPEQLTKHPDVTLQVLRSGGAKCGAGEAQEILTRCPAERFCKLPGGELCVYGLPDAPRMTQLTAADWQALAAATVPASSPAPAASAPASAASTQAVPATDASSPSLAWGLVMLLVGVAIGRVWRRRR